MAAQDPRTGARTVLTAALAAISGLVLSACGGSDSSASSVFSVKVGECFRVPSEVKAQVSDLDRVPCSKEHDQEAYALVAYTGSSGDDGGAKKSDPYPGEDVLDAFAQGACAERFADYVGVNYLDSSYYFTYLTPSPRSWQEKDRTTLCLVTDAGKPMVGSVKGSAL